MNYLLLTHTEMNSEHDFYMIHCDPKVTTVNEGLRKLYSLKNPILKYTQNIPIHNIYYDLSYSSLIDVRPENQTLTIRFPKECSIVSNFMNNHNCKMCLQYFDKKTDRLIQVCTNPFMNVNLVHYRDIQLIVYTKNKQDLIISFDTYLIKNKLLSAL